jgi:hypothetical protein
MYNGILALGRKVCALVAQLSVLMNRKAGIFRNYGGVSYASGLLFCTLFVLLQVILDAEHAGASF